MRRLRIELSVWRVPVGASKGRKCGGDIGHFTRLSKGTKVLHDERLT